MGVYSGFVASSTYSLLLPVLEFFSRLSYTKESRRFANLGATTP